MPSLLRQQCDAASLSGIDPRNIAFAPYIPVVRRGSRWTRAPRGWTSTRRSRLCDAGGRELLGATSWRTSCDTPLAAQGRDAARGHRHDGEIVLARNGEIVSCAAPAGPCFEGANISSGMRASDGAISSLRLKHDGDFEVQTIAGAKPRGFCGSGLIDAIAVLLDAGLVDETGRLLPSDEHGPDVSPKAASRLRRNGDGMAEVVFAADHLAMSR